MPRIVRKSASSVIEARRDVLHAASWQVRSNVWSPPTDVYETEDAIVVRLEIAGMREEDLEVNVENDMLLISGFRPDLPERRAYHRMEIRFGKFVTAIGLPGKTNVDEARAEYRDGFLTITLPKAKPNQVKVES